MGEYNCYVLESLDEDRVTYVGMTNNLHQRLRRHNGEIVGGAKATRGRQHKHLFYVSGFPTIVDAERFEWALKYPNGKGKSKGTKAAGRYAALLTVACRDKWTSKSDPASGFVLTIHWLGEPEFYLNNKDKFPPYIFHDTRQNE